LSVALAAEAHHRRTRIGLLFGLSAALLWGCFPLYFRYLKTVPPLEMVAVRIVWSVMFLALLLPLVGQFGAFARIWRVPRTIGLLALSATLIAVNWLVFVICATTGHVVEGGLGYFILPLVNVVLGRVFLKERLTPRQVTACLLATVGVVLFMIAAGRGIFLSLFLAGSFGAYGLVRKIVAAEALAGVAVENVLLLPVSALYLWWGIAHGTLHVAAGPPTLTEVMLAGTGVITVLPLVLYTGAARRLSMATLGIIFYVSPTMQFLQGSLLYGEPMSPLRLAGCIVIWVALIVYTSDRQTAA
jgi:chloramphenicol-sensitive protein RarD